MTDTFQYLELITIFGLEQFLNLEVNQGKKKKGKTNLKKESRKQNSSIPR